MPYIPGIPQTGMASAVQGLMSAREARRGRQDRNRQLAMQLAARGGGQVLDVASRLGAAGIRAGAAERQHQATLDAMESLRDAQQRLYEAEEKESLYKQSPEQRDLERRRLEAQIKETEARARSFSPAGGLFTGPLGDFERAALESNMGLAGEGLATGVADPQSTASAAALLRSPKPADQRRAADWTSDIAATVRYAPQIKEAMGGQDVPLLGEDLRAMSPLELAAIFGRLGEKLSPVQEQQVVRELVRRFGGPFELRTLVPEPIDVPPMPEVTDEQIAAALADIPRRRTVRIAGTPEILPISEDERRRMARERVWSSPELEQLRTQRQELIPQAQETRAQQQALMRALEMLDSLQREQLPTEAYNILYDVPLPKTKKSR